MLATFLLPDQEGLALDDCQIEDQSKTTTLYVTATQPSATCPTCREVSERVHSHYRRTALDLPYAGYAVQLFWTVRRFFCDNPICHRRTFAESLPTRMPRYGRKTLRRLHKQSAMAFESGGEPGQRLAAISGFPASADSLLRLIRTTSLPPAPTPRVLGVDDWVKRRGQTYGTILIDLEAHRRIDLLQERSAAALATWLSQHPGIEIISRDRSLEYAKGATQGAPLAIQVADGWHLIHDLREVVVTYLEQHRAGLLATAQPIPLAAAGETTSPTPEPVNSIRSPEGSLNLPLAPSTSAPIAVNCPMPISEPSARLPPR